MPDEISQVCQLEIQGIQFVVKGGLEAAKLLFKGLQALFRWGADKIVESQGMLTEYGNKTLRGLYEISKEEQPQTLYIPEDVSKEVIEKLHKAGARFFIPPDRFRTFLCRNSVIFSSFRIPSSSSRLSVPRLPVYHSRRLSSAVSSSRSGVDCGT